MGARGCGGPVIGALVADDDRGTAALLRARLGHWGLEVRVAHDGDEAWALIQAHPEIALAVLDWSMPGLNGPDICRYIRAHPGRAQLHVIILTARETREDVIAALDAGADDFMVKPFDPEVLRAKIHVGLRVVKLQERLAERVTELERALSEVKQLHGLLPICSYCKHVRSDDNYWEQVEDYVSQHSHLQFSHGICPACFARVSAELDLK
jgi:phosphoserine phosphatase RsbU/P